MPRKAVPHVKEGMQKSAKLFLRWDAERTLLLFVQKSHDILATISISLHRKSRAWKASFHQCVKTTAEFGGASLSAHGRLISASRKRVPW